MIGWRPMPSEPIGPESSKKKIKWLQIAMNCVAADSSPISIEPTGVFDIATRCMLLDLIKARPADHLEFVVRNHVTTGFINMLASVLYDGKSKRKVYVDMVHELFTEAIPIAAPAVVSDPEPVFESLAEVFSYRWEKLQ